MLSVLVANGQLQPSQRIRDLWQQADLRIAADGGARNARRALNLAPHVVIGDLDSMDEPTRAWLDTYDTEIIAHPPAKDATDLELALDLARTRGADQIVLIGALGGRMDQLLANVMLLTREPALRLLDAQGEMWVAERRASVEGSPGDIVSLIPLDLQVEEIQTHQLEYPLRRETLERGSTRGISNVMLAERAVIEWKQGALLVSHLFQSK